MKKIYRSTQLGKKEFTDEVITVIVQQLGYEKAYYLCTKDGTEYIYLLKDNGNIIYDVVKKIEVTADSLTTMIADVMLNA